MLTRHWQVAASLTANCFGHDRRLGLAALADGVCTVAATAGCVAAFGLVGVPLGSLASCLLTNAPTCAATLAREAGRSVAGVLGWAAPWAVRFAAVFGPVAAAAGLGWVRTPAA